MMPPPSNVGRNPRKGPNSVELLKVDASGQVGVSDKFGPLKAIHVLKDVLELMIIKPPPVANALHQEEDAAMEVKEKRLIAFSSSDSTNDQLLGMINADQAYHNSEDVGNNARLSQCKADILSLLSKANTLASLDDAQLNISLSSLREKISTVAIEMADEEAEMEKNRVRRTKQDAKWEYLCGKLAQEIVRLADAMQFDLPTDVKVYSMYSIVQEKIRIADALKERVVSAHGTDSKSNLDVLNAAEPSGIIAEFEDDMTDDVAVVVALDREKSESKERDLDSSSDSDSGEESIKPLRYRQNVDANTVASNKSSPQKYFYYNRDRRRVSSILPSGTIHGMAGGRGVHKSVGYRVLAMATQEEIAEKERLKKLEEDRFKAEQEAKENDVSASVIRKNKRIEEFQKGLMNEIRESVSSLISRNLGVSNMEGRKEKRQTTIGRLLVDNEDAANKKRTMLAGSNLEGEMNRQQLILSMIGRSTARASNAAETLKSRTQTQRPAVLQMQLELGLQKRSKEDAQHKGSLSNECVSPDNGSIDNDDHVKEVSLEETFHWLVGRYQHNVAVQPSTTIVDILNLISNNGMENSSSANDLQMIKDNLSMQTDTDITDLIEKLSIEISQNVMMNTPLSPSHSAYPGKSKECTVGSNLPEVIEDPVDDLATTGSYIAAYERTRDESDCEDSSVSNNLMNNATRIGRNRTVCI